MAKINYYGGMPNAQKLAAGWVHRLAYFFNVYTESNDPDFKFDDATISAYEEDPAFSAWVAGLAPNDKCVTRAKQLRKIFPSRVHLEKKSRHSSNRTQKGETARGCVTCPRHSFPLGYFIRF